MAQKELVFDSTLKENMVMHLFLQKFPRKCHLENLFMFSFRTSRTDVSTQLLTIVLPSELNNSQVVVVKD